MMNRWLHIFQDFGYGFQEGAKKFGDNFQQIIILVLSFFMYFIGIGVSALYAKIVGKHFLEMKVEKKKKTYWSDLHLTKQERANYYRQF